MQNCSWGVGPPGEVGGAHATTEVSIARMVSPAGWSEQGQTPQFNEYTVVLRGELHVRLKGRTLVAAAGQAVLVEAGEWVQYATPDGAEYVSVCTPAFSPERVHRDELGPGAV